nr:MetaGeneMark_Unknown Function [uncultured bacterium]
MMSWSDTLFIAVAAACVAVGMNSALMVVTLAGNRKERFK